jgi:hypothetical protein
MLNCSTVLPTDDFFPDPFDRGEEGLQKLFQRVCRLMDIDPPSVDLQILPDANQSLSLLPEYRHSSNDAAGLYFGHDNNRAFIAVRHSLADDPLVAVATIAHELCHTILIGGGHIDRDAEDMEPMTDLSAIFLGFGIFIGNAARRFRQYHEDRRAGWSMTHLGYLPEEVCAYALARFASERGEVDPSWRAFLSTNLKAYYRQSEAWIASNPAS